MLTRLFFALSTLQTVFAFNVFDVPGVKVSHECFLIQPLETLYALCPSGFDSYQISTAEWTVESAFSLNLPYDGRLAYATAGQENDVYILSETPDSYVWYLLDQQNDLHEITSVPWFFE
jgi:hypothetical protein